MGAIDTVVGETTKWLLSKVDKLFAKRKPTYKDKANMLFSCLSKIDDSFTALKKTILPTLNNDRYSSDNPYNKSKTILNEIKNYIKETISIYNEIRYDIELYSKKDKKFWDQLQNFLISLEKDITNFSQNYDYSWDLSWIVGESEKGFFYYHTSNGSGCKDSETIDHMLKQYNSAKRKLNKKIRNFNWDRDKVLKDYIEALKRDISSASEMD